jgi:hypothetical protein
MKILLTIVTIATLFAAPLSSTAYAGLPGAWYQQQQSGYPQSPPGGS